MEYINRPLFHWCIYCEQDCKVKGGAVCGNCFEAFEQHHDILKDLTTKDMCRNRSYKND